MKITRSLFACVLALTCAVACAQVGTGNSGGSTGGNGTGGGTGNNIPPAVSKFGKPFAELIADTKAEAFALPTHNEVDDPDSDLFEGTTDDETVASDAEAITPHAVAKAEASVQLVATKQRVSITESNKLNVNVMTVGAWVVANSETQYRMRTNIFTGETDKNGTTPTNFNGVKAKLTLSSTQNSLFGGEYEIRTSSRGGRWALVSIQPDGIHVSYDAEPDQYFPFINGTATWEKDIPESAFPVEEFNSQEEPNMMFGRWLIVGRKIGGTLGTGRTWSFVNWYWGPLDSTVQANWSFDLLTTE